MIKIIHANIVTEETILNDYNLIIEDDKILSIEAFDNQNDFQGTIIDANHQYLMPGFIDIHSDYIEHVASPRTKIILSLENALHEFEKECLAHGITTMYHSVSLWNGTGSKPLRNKDTILAFAELLKATHEKKHLIHNRLHIRYEVDNLDQIDVLESLILADKCDLLSFMDHTPGQGQYRDIEQYKKYIKSMSKYEDEKIDELIHQSIMSKKLSFEDMANISNLAKKHGVILASHDDDTLEKIDQMIQLESSISEFPITLDVAKFAKAKGLFTLVGAPNILLGESSTGNLSALEAIEHKAADMVCSDYFPAALLHALFKLFERGMALHEAVKMFTLNPAKALKIEAIKGSIKVGKVADMLIVDVTHTKQPQITHVFVSGQKVMSLSYRGSV